MLYKQNINIKIKTKFAGEKGESKILQTLKIVLEKNIGN